MARFQRRFNSMCPEVRPFYDSSDEEMEEADDCLGVQECSSAPMLDDAFNSYSSSFRDSSLCRSLSENFGTMASPLVTPFPTSGFQSENQPLATQAFRDLSTSTFTSFPPTSMTDARFGLHYATSSLPSLDVNVVNIRSSSAAIPFRVDQTMEDACHKTPPASPSSCFLMGLDTDESSQTSDQSHGFMAPSSDSLSLDLPRASNAMASTSPSRFIEGSCTFRGIRPPTPEAQAPLPPVSRQRSGLAERSERMEEMARLQETQRKLRHQQIEEQEMSPQQARPMYMRGDGTAMVPKKRPTLKSKSGSEVDADHRTAYRCQSMPTTELEMLYNRQELHDPLPTLPNCSSTRVINSQTLVKLMEGHYKEQIDGYFIIDCRYPYEFDGGHIKGAENIPPSEAESKLTQMFMDRAALLATKRVAIVFHCEFSSKRGPSAFKLLRGLDRTANYQRYPKMFFPHMYVLEGGYKEFFSQYPMYCFPMCYVTMKDKKYAKELKHNTRLKAISEKQRSLSCSNFNLASLRESIGRTRSNSREPQRMLSQSTQVAGSQRARSRTSRNPFSQRQRDC